MRTLFTLLASSLLLQASAQTIIHQDLSTFGVSTDMLLGQRAELPALSTGADQQWDLSNMPLAPVGSMDFTAAAGTPYATDFPEANWVWIHSAMGQTAYYYLQITPEGIDLLDRNVGLDDPVIYVDPVQVMKFPLSLGESFEDTYSTGTDENMKHWTFVGYGELTLPVGQFSNVALITSEEGDIVFWNHHRLYPIMIADNGSTVNFYMQNNVGVEEHAAGALHVWPNPCGDRLNLLNVAAGTPWSILDMQGRTIRSGTMASGSDPVPTAGLAAGSYVLRLIDGAGQRPLRFIKG